MVDSGVVIPTETFQERQTPFNFYILNYTVKEIITMAGHSKLHPYFKSYDELKRTINRMQLYLDMHRALIPENEKRDIIRMIELLETAVDYIPEEYHVSRFKQFKDKK